MLYKDITWLMEVYMPCWKYNYVILYNFYNFYIVFEILSFQSNLNLTT